MNHLNDNELKMLENGNISMQSRIGFTEHMADCAYCAGRFADICETNMFSLPNEAKRKIKKNAPLYLPNHRKQREFRSYCIKTCIACVCAIAIVAVFNKNWFTKAKPIDDGIPNMLKINQKIDDIKDFFTFKEDKQ